MTFEKLHAMSNEELEIYTDKCVDRNNKIIKLLDLGQLFKACRLMVAAMEEKK